MATPTPPAPPPAAPAPVPAPKPASGPSTAGKPATLAPPPPRTGSVADQGVVRHETVHAERWTVAGTTKVVSEADAASIDARGTVAIGGALTADSCAVTGSLDVGGGIEVRTTLHVDGHLRGRSTVHTGALEVKGTARCGGAVRADQELTVRGALIAPSVRATALHLHGAADVPGDLEASTVEARFEEDSRIGRIVGSSIRLRGRVPTLVDKAFFRHATVTIERIEGQKVELEAVHVALVHAEEVVLGRDAHISELEGTVVRRHSTARVGPRSKSPPPYGLSR